MHIRYKQDLLVDLFMEELISILRMQKYATGGDAPTMSTPRGTRRESSYQHRHASCIMKIAVLCPVPDIQCTYKRIVWSTFYSYQFSFAVLHSEPQSNSLGNTESAPLNVRHITHVYLKASWA